MKGQFYIDGVDIFNEFGIFVSQGGHAGLVGYPSLKPIQFNDWAEYDGIEPDLSRPLLDSKEFPVSFGCINSLYSENFIDSLTDGAYHQFNFKEIDCTRKLRMVSQPNKQTFGHLELFSLQFADDFPLEGYQYLAPTQGVQQTGYSLNNRSFADYGVYILEGSDDEINKTPAVKVNQKKNYFYKSGLMYDAKNVVYQSKEVNLSCLLRAPDTKIFWQNYNALLYDLIRPNERMLNNEYKCYYKNSKVNRFELIRSSVWCEFTLTLVFTSFRPLARTFVLGTDDSMFITDQNKLIEI